MLHSLDSKTKDDLETHIEQLHISENNSTRRNKIEKSSNLYGRAFISVVELEPPGRSDRSEKRKYPIQRVPALFYATKPINTEKKK